MGKRRAEPQEQPTIWEIPDEVWPLVHMILDTHDPAKLKGHRRVDLSGASAKSTVSLGTSAEGGAPWPYVFAP
jgi:hypothetical protein